MEIDFTQAVESLDKVPEQFRPLYTETADKKFALDTKFKGIGDAFTGLNGALKAERKNKPKPIDLSLLADFGDSPEKIHEGITTRIKTLEEQLAAGQKINPEKLKQEFVTAHQGEITKHQNRNQALQGQLYSLLVDNAAISAVTEAKGSPELLLPQVRSQVKVLEEDGKFNVYVVDSAGDKRFSGVTGQPVTIKELVAEMKGDKRFARAFDSEAPSGGGKPPGSGNGPVRTNRGNDGQEKSSSGPSEPRGDPSRPIRVIRKDGAKVPNFSLQGESKWRLLHWLNQPSCAGMN
jgi:hypothetical protein